MFEAFLTRHEVRGSDLLVKQGDHDRTMYLLESGTLQVLRAAAEDRPAAVDPARRARSSARPACSATSRAWPMSRPWVNCVVWALRGPRYEELAARNPALTLEVVRAAAALMGVRMRANIENGQAVS